MSVPLPDGRKAQVGSGLPSPVRVLAWMAAGIAVGIAAHRFPGAGSDRIVAVVEPFGTIWLGALQMLVAPLIVSMLIATIGRAGTVQAGRLGWSSLSWCVALLAAGAIVTVPVSMALLHWAPLGDASLAAFQGPAIAADVQPAAPGVRDWLVNLVPSNLVRAAADGALLPLIVAAALFGAALNFVEGRSRALLLDLAQAVSEWCFALAGLLFRVLPQAVFALTLVSTAQSGAGMVSALVYYVVAISALLAAATLALYPLTSWLGAVPLSRFARAVWPVQLLAFSTRSSVACLPAMLGAAREGLRLPEEVYGFTLPFTVSTFKLNMAISANFQMFFLLHLYGLHPDPVALAIGVLALTAQSVATPGLPSGAVWTTTPVYLALGIPLEGVVLTNVVDTIPDLFKTIANVTGNLSVTAIVARRWQAGSARR